MKIVINFIAVNEDYIPISEILTFALVTNDTQCVTITILNDFVIEDEEVFLLQSTDITSLTETTPKTVMIVIVDDDGNFLIYDKHDCADKGNTPIFNFSYLCKLS